MADAATNSSSTVTSQPQAAAAKPVRHIAMHSYFYRDGYVILRRLSLALTITICILAGGLVLLAMNTRITDVVFATTGGGNEPQRMINVVPLDQPYLSRGDLVSWAADTAQRTLLFSYRDYNLRLQDVASNFTQSGWNSLLKMLGEYHIIEGVEARKLVINSTLIAAPEIVAEGPVNGVYNWVMQFPILVESKGADRTADLRLTLRLTIVRVPTTQHPKGVGISQWVAVQRQ